MAKARLYSLNTEVIAAGKAKKYVAELKGQAKIVYDDLRSVPEPRLAVDVEKSCGHRIVTRQDPFRVVLYYILVFKSKGIITVTEPAAEDTESAPDYVLGQELPAEETTEEPVTE